MRKSRRSWITARSLRAYTSPADSKELTPPVGFSYQPASDAESQNPPSGNPEMDLGLHRTSSGKKTVVKAIVRHPENPELVLFGLRRDDDAWCVPGGHLEPDEDPEDGMHREFLEECGLHLASAEHVFTHEPEGKPVIVMIFEGEGPSPRIWDQLSSVADPDSEFACYQYINPLDTDFPLHIPREHNAVVKYLEAGRTGYLNSLRDLTTEKEARRTAILRQRHNDKTDRLEWALLSKKKPHHVLRWFGAQKPSEERVKKEEGRIHFFEHHGQAPDPTLFGRTDESLGDAYKSENQFEDADLHLGAAQPYDSNGTSPADPMRESLGEEHIVQYASQGTMTMQAAIQPSIHPGISTENSKGLGVELDNKREDIALMKDLSIRTPV